MTVKQREQREELILRRALEKGLITELPPVNLAAAKSDTVRGAVARWGWRIDYLLHNGKLDIASLEALAKEIESDRSHETVHDTRTNQLLGDSDPASSQSVTEIQTISP